VKSLVFTVNSFTGQNFSHGGERLLPHLRHRQRQGSRALRPVGAGPHTAQIMAKLYRHNGEWKMHAIGENGSGRTFDDLMPLITPHL
jgi:tellurium resistance protein TerZ